MKLSISEAEFQRMVIQYAELQSWKVLHVRKSVGRRDGESAWQTTTNIKGWPDCFMWHERMKRQLAVELKSQKGVISPDQVDILTSLALSGVESHLWRPADWDLVERTLKWERKARLRAPNAGNRST